MKKLPVLFVVGLFSLTSAACSDDTAENADAAVTKQDKSVTPRDGGPGDGPRGEAKQKDQALTDKNNPKPDAKVPAHWTTITNNVPEGSYQTATLLPNGDVLITGGNNKDSAGADVVLKKTYRYQTAKGTFVSAGDMATERESHTATLLKNGKVLVTGGASNSTYLATTEIFDPATMKWTAGPKMDRSRWDHVAVRLKNDWIMISGGFGNSDSIKDVVLYDPTNNKFTTPAHTLSEARRSHTMTLLNDGRVFIAGGITGSSQWKWVSSGTTEIYDPKTGTFTAGPKLSRPRNSHTATLRSDGSVLIVGGAAWQPPAGISKTNDLFDPIKGTMITISYPGSYLPAGHKALLLSDGSVLVVDDERVTAFSPKMGGVWDALPALPDKRWSCTATLLKNNKVLVTGGVVSSSPYTFANTALLLHL